MSIGQFFKERTPVKQLKIALLLATTALVSLAIGSSYYYYSPLYPAVTKATAVIVPTKGNVVHGVVTFTQEPQGLHIVAKLENLTPGKHGFHIHEFGNCACPDAVCAGDHFNPTGSKHGGPDSKERHVGDFGNIVADESGVGTYDAIDTHATLNGPHSIVGRTVIIHAGEDDLTSQPSGNAGARIGCGVVGISKTHSFWQSLFEAFPPEKRPTSRFKIPAY